MLRSPSHPDLSPAKSRRKPVDPLSPFVLNQIRNIERVAHQVKANEVFLVNQDVHDVLMAPSTNPLVQRRLQRAKARNSPVAVTGKIKRSSSSPSKLSPIASSRGQPVELSAFVKMVIHEIKRAAHNAKVKEIFFTIQDAQDRVSSAVPGTSAERATPQRALARRRNSVPANVALGRRLFVIDEDE